MEIEFMIFQALTQLLCGFIGIKLGYRSAVKKFEKGQLKNVRQKKIAYKKSQETSQSQATSC